MVVPTSKSVVLAESIVASPVTVAGALPKTGSYTQPIALFGFVMIIVGLTLLRLVYPSESTAD